MVLLRRLNMKFEIDLNDNEVDLLFTTLELRQSMCSPVELEEIKNLIKKFEQAISKIGK